MGVVALASRPRTATAAGQRPGNESVRRGVAHIMTGNSCGSLLTKRRHIDLLRLRDDC